VANRHLPYERTLGERFDEIRSLGEEGGYKLVAASRPVRPRGGRSRARR